MNANSETETNAPKRAAVYARYSTDLQSGSVPLEVISLHPATLKRYEGQLADLQAALAKGIRSGDTEAARAMRELVDTVTVSRDPNRQGGVEVEIAGRLNHLLGPEAFPQGVRAVWGEMVAEDRYVSIPPISFGRFAA